MARTGGERTFETRWTYQFARCTSAAGSNWEDEGDMQLLLITGPAGVGKSTLSWEMSAQLAAAQVAHAVIETDELDRVFPRPNADELDRIQPGTTDVSSINLAAIWSTYRALGHTRLIMSGVMMHLDLDKRWILSAIPEAQITVVYVGRRAYTIGASCAARDRFWGGRAGTALASASKAHGERRRRRHCRSTYGRQRTCGTCRDSSSENWLAH
jgi:hypothetical protein